jgi:hypothetical protein
MNESAFNILTLEHVATTVAHPKTHVEVLEAFFSRIEKLGRVKRYDASDIQLSARLRDVSIDHPIYSPTTHGHGSYSEMQRAMRERASRADLPQTRARVRSSSMELLQDDAHNQYEDQMLYTYRIYRVPGYGARQPNISRLPNPSYNFSQKEGTSQRNKATRNPNQKWSGTHVCFVCRKQYCHSSNHKEQVWTTLAKKFDYVLSQSATLDDEINKEQEKESNLQAKDFLSGDEAIGYVMMTQLIHTLVATITFNGIALDTCANFKSTVVTDVFQSMQALWPSLVAGTTADGVVIRGVGGKNESTSSFTFSFMFGGRSYEMIVRHIPGPTPLVMCQATMNEFGFSYQSFEALLVRVSDGFSRKVKIINGLPFLAVEHGFETLISASELRKSHRNLGHPSVSTIMRTLDAVSLTNPGDRAQLEKISQVCRTCQLLSAKPKRFGC